MRVIEQRRLGVLKASACRIFVGSFSIALLFCCQDIRHCCASAVTCLEPEAVGVSWPNTDLFKLSDGGLPTSSRMVQHRGTTSEDCDKRLLITIVCYVGREGEHAYATGKKWLFMYEPLVW